MDVFTLTDRVAYPDYVWMTATIEPEHGLVLHHYGTDGSEYHERAADGARVERTDDADLGTFLRSLPAYATNAS